MCVIVRSKLLSEGDSMSAQHEAKCDGQPVLAPWRCAAAWFISAPKCCRSTAYMCVCVRARARACVRACESVCAFEHVCVRMRVNGERDTLQVVSSLICNV